MREQNTFFPMIKMKFKVKFMNFNCISMKKKKSKKKKAMIFNSKIKTDFMPKLFLQDGYQIEVVEEIKLLGITITSDLIWGKNTKKHH